MALTLTVGEKTYHCKSVAPSCKSFTSTENILSQAPVCDRNVHSIAYDYHNPLPGTIPLNKETILATRLQTTNFWIKTLAFNNSHVYHYFYM